MTPLSQTGKIFCMIYAAIGIPLTLVLLSAMVEKLLIPANWFLGLLNSKLGHLYQPFNIRVIHLTIVGKFKLVFQQDLERVFVFNFFFFFANTYVGHCYCLNLLHVCCYVILENNYYVFITFKFCFLFFHNSYNCGRIIFCNTHCCVCLFRAIMGCLGCLLLLLHLIDNNWIGRLYTGRWGID